MTVLNIKRGFTLIELLIVKAILGVLAVVVLVAINPVQQLARTRDTGRISGVTQIGHAVSAFYTTRNATYPADLQALVDAGELTAIPAEITNTLTSLCTAPGTGDAAEGWCYVSDANGAAVWSELESDSYQSQCDTGSGPAPAWAAYSTAAGRGGITCAEPTTSAVTFLP